MDPWSNHLNQAYGRLPPGTGLASNPTFHLLAEQQGFGTVSGLGASLSNPLPAHAATHFTGLTHMNYGALHSSMTPLFDPMTLSQTFTGGATYKTVPVVPTMYTLDPNQGGAGGGSSSHDTLAGRFVTQNTGQSSAKTLIFNPDTHTMTDSSGLPVSIASGGSSAQATWNRLNFAPANPYDGLTGVVERSGGGGANKGSQEPPPAHSGSRPSAIHRNAYQGILQSSPPQPQPPQQRSRPTHQPASSAVYESSANQDLTPPTAHANPQRLAELDIMKLLQSGQKFYADNTGTLRYLDTGVAASHLNKPLSRTTTTSHRDTAPPVSGGYATASPHVHEQPSGRTTAVNRSLQQQQQQQHQPSGYAEQPSYVMSNYSDGGGGGSTLSYSASPAIMDSYDSISSPELSRDQNSAVTLLAQQSAAAAAALAIQQSARPVFPGMEIEDNQPMHGQLQLPASTYASMIASGAMGGNMDVNLLTIQALADSTTKPKRNRGGKAAAAATASVNAGATAATAARDGNITVAGKGRGSGTNGQTVIGGVLVQQQPPQQQPTVPSGVNLGGLTAGGVDGGNAAPAGNKRKGKGKGKKSKNDASDQSYLQQQQLDNYNQLAASTVAAGYNQLMSQAAAGFGQAGSEYQAEGGDYANSAAATAYRMQQQSKLAAGYQASLMSQMSAMFDSGASAAARQEEPQVFMTNMYGSAFVNPNEVLPGTTTLDPASLSALLSGAVAGGLAGAIGGKKGDEDEAGEDGAGGTKQRPVPQIIDEDFGHLSDPVLTSSVATKIEPSVPKSTAPAGFMSSFLNFVHGKKPDTLTTAATTPAVSKPVLPKYNPEITPKRVAPPTPAAPVSTAKTGGAVQSTKSGDVKTGTVGFMKSGASASGQYSPPMCKPALKTATNLQAMTLSKASPLKMVIKTPPSGGGAKRRRRRSRYSDDDFVEGEDGVPANGESEEEKEFVGRDAKGVDIIVPPREKSLRKAKEKAELKRIATSSKNKGRRTYDSDDDADLDGPTYNSGSDQDSDSDPAWRPSESLRNASDHRGHGGEATGGRRRRGRQPVKTAIMKPMGGPRAVHLAAVSPPTSGANTSVVATNSQSHGSESKDSLSGAAAMETNVVPSDPDAPHSFQKGDYVIDRRDLDNYVSFPIWKIDTGRLLQKFEPTDKDGHIVHRSLSTYSSWSETIQHNYKAILVKQLPSLAKGVELVDVIDKYRPRPPSAAKLATEAIQESFNVFVQILVSQSLEPTFLEALLQEPDDYYMSPLEKVDSVLKERADKMRDVMNWTPSFTEEMNKYSQFCVSAVPEGATCQALGNGVVAVKSVRFYGQAYDSQTLTRLDDRPLNSAEELHIGQSTLDCLPLYHALRHVKWTLYRMCQAKVDEVRVSPDTPDHEVLDGCLQNTNWMQQLFQQLTNLLEEIDKWHARQTTASLQ